jgi:hypothetical protein
MFSGLRDLPPQLARAGKNPAKKFREIYSVKAGFSPIPDEVGSLVAK